MTEIDPPIAGWKPMPAEPVPYPEPMTKVIALLEKIEAQTPVGKRSTANWSACTYADVGMLLSWMYRVREEFASLAFDVQTLRQNLETMYAVERTYKNQAIEISKESGR